MTYKYAASWNVNGIKTKYILSVSAVSDRSVPGGELRFVSQCVEHLKKLKGFEKISFGDVFTMNELFEKTMDANLDFSIGRVLVHPRRPLDFF